MEPTDQMSSPEIETMAADWVARRDAGLDAAGTADLLRWLEADPRHGEAMREVETAWRIFDLPRARGVAHPVMRELVQRERRLRQRLLTGAAASVLLVAGALTWISLPKTSYEPTIAAPTVAVIRPEIRTLPDGSRVEIARGVAIEVHYTPAEREVVLKTGQAHFTVVHDARRPFVVTTPNSRVRDVGTVFAVEAQPVATDVLVTEGKVAIDNPAVSTPPVLVAAGNVSHVTGQHAASAPVAVSTQEMDRLLAWRSPRVEFTDAALPDVAAAFNRANRVQLVVANPTLRALRVTGVFRADRVEDFVRLLTKTYGVEVVRPQPDRIELTRR